MNKNERRIYDELQREGYEVFHRGWPDFLVLKDGVARLIELKTPGDKVSPCQAQLHDALRRGLGLNVEVIKIETVDKINWDLALVKKLRKCLHKTIVQKGLSIEARRPYGTQAQRIHTDPQSDRR